jgi:phage shock protein E
MNPRSGLALFAILAAGIVQADTPVITVSQEALLHREQQSDQELLVLDVRSPEEFVSGHVPGAVNVPYDQVAARFAELPKDKDIVLYCRSGRRAQLAADVLAGNGYTRLQHLEGDMAAWTEAGRPVAVPGDKDACLAALKTGGALAPAACNTP